MNSFQDARFRGMRAAWDGFTIEQLDLLHPHIINLTRGQLSTGGAASTSSADLETIFGHYLPKALEVAQKQGRELPIVFYAHGGLVSEQNALVQALHQIPWWKQNGIYPIYFIWETGFWETVLQLAGIVRELQPSGDARAYITDPLIETIVRNAGGQRVWLGMKESARLAFEKTGGGTKAVELLEAFAAKNPDGISLHAIGHSAGAIFQHHFLSTALKALKAPAPGFQTLQLLAPAITVQDFHDQLAKQMGKPSGIKNTTIFTLRKELETKDNSAKVYGKSLLYLIHNALEAEPQTPVLGLAESLYGDVELQKKFGLRGQESDSGAVIFAPTATDAPGRSASQAKQHGEFDNDSSTMNSVLRRIQRKEDKDPIVAYPPDPMDRSLLTGTRFEQFNWPTGLAEWFFPNFGQTNLPAVSTASQTTSGLASMGDVIVTGGGRRRALCVGINAYQSSPLLGCVADARLWAQTLGELGFETQTLLDGQATFDGILNGLRQMVQESRVGDVLVFQYAGHGTQLPDVNGDETGQDTSAQDEAICPFDYTSGRFVLDDDIAEVFSLLKSSQRGVSMTCFIDCCHSGTISRFAVGVPTGQRSLGPNARARVLTVPDELVESHRLFRRTGGRGRSLFSRGPDGMSEVVFSACLSSEKAYESNQQGDFTRNATAVLRQYGLKLTNEEFERRVRDAFGSQGRQHPNLDCAFAVREQWLLQPLTVLA